MEPAHPRTALFPSSSGSLARHAGRALIAAALAAVVVACGAKPASETTPASATGASTVAAPATSAAPAVMCELHGKRYAVGEHFRDDCNTCTCNDKGFAACTEMACAKASPSAASSTGPVPAAHSWSTPGGAADRKAFEETFKKVVDAMHKRDGEALAKLVDAGGVRLSPNQSFDRDNPTLDVAAIRSCFTDRTVREWGVQDPSGEPVKATCAAHLADYAKTLDDRKATTLVSPAFAEVREVEFTNEHVLRTFPGAAWVDVLVPGTAKTDGLDYHGVRLIFVKRAEGWKLVGALHEFWTP